MATYYDYLRDRVLASQPGDPAQLEQLVHGERNALWQQVVANPAYDEQGRLHALAAFDEAASRILSEQSAWFGRQPTRDVPNILARAQKPSLPPQRPQPSQPREEEHFRADAPRGGRPILRDALFLLAGLALGFLIGYLFSGGASGLLSSKKADNELGVVGLDDAAPKSFKFVRNGPSPLEGEVNVEYARGAEAGNYDCTVDATYRQVLEYVRFEDSCRRVAFKFLPLPKLWDEFNYVEGYMVFSAIITSPTGTKWEGSTSVFFSINGEVS
ncbi:hypothetical protein [Hyphomicrobium sp. CS1GBMeth3]|uniref:hypothetical protein n=1 Tax=Hyphomicrobium sp. CS1GBMeth3 TaxID=1892845 RepID=UPI00093048AA|nr:hypothetical protein [Hyphomicrobium sp. CS1GBMeth3]